MEHPCFFVNVVDLSSLEMGVVVGIGIVWSLSFMNDMGMWKASNMINRFTALACFVNFTAAYYARFKAFDANFTVTSYAFSFD